MYKILDSNDPGIDLDKTSILCDVDPKVFTIYDVTIYM